MKFTVKTLLIILFSTSILNSSSAQKKGSFKPKVVYKSKSLVITQISKHSFEHTSFLKTQDFGKVACNGLVVINSNEAIVFDTPTNDTNSAELIKWIKETRHCKINAIIPTHFHNDCLGGLNAFDKNNIPSYAYFKTIEFAKEHDFVVPKNDFKDSLVLKVGDEHITVRFLGEGHTKDNVVGYYPGDDVLFGGCLIKELKANKGYLGDANVAAWSGTVENVKKEYPNVKIIVPGHGEIGNKALLDYTIRLFKTQ